MKKLVFAFTLILSITSNAQYDTKTINDIKVIFQTDDDQVAIDFLDGLYTYAKEHPLKTVKYGDTDAPLIKGLLKTLFTDSLTKYKYVEANPRIAALHVSSQTYNPELENKNMTFIKWITEYVTIIDTTKFDIVYKTTYDKEFIYIYDKTDVDHITCLRKLMITYGDAQTLRSDPYNNFASIHDSALNP